MMEERELTPEQERGEEMYYRLMLWVALDAADKEVKRIEKQLCELTCGEKGRASWGCPIHLNDFERLFDGAPEEALPTP